MRALIIGVSGQDGAYLAEMLLRKGYDVYGTSRDANLSPFVNLARLGIRERVTLLSLAPNDFRSTLAALVRGEPDEIYNLSGQSSVGLSFEQPVETMESIGIATLNILEAIRFTKRKVRFYSAGSGECFGDTGGRAATEETPFRPRSPYAAAKAAAHFEVANYRAPTASSRVMGYYSTMSRRSDPSASSLARSSPRRAVSRAVSRSG